MNNRLRLGPPKHTLPHTSGRRMRPSSLPSGVHTVTPLKPTERPALLEHHRLPSTSQRTPSGPHFTPSTMKSLNSFRFVTRVLATSNTNISRVPPGPLSPGPRPVLITYNRL